VLYVLDGSEYKKITNDREISVKDLERWANWGGFPPVYYVWEFSGTRKIKFLGNGDTINGKTYELYYIKKPTTELSSDSDTSLAPEEYREAAPYYAASQLKKQIGQTEMAAAYMQEFLRIVREAQEHVERRDLNYDLPRPDLNIGDVSTIDVQGGGNPV
jgi:hypothetical protein